MSGFFGVQAHRKKKWVMSGLGQGGVHAFYAAIQTGDVDTIRSFLDKGAPVDFRSKSMTALHLAVLRNIPIIIELILGNGASIEAKGGEEQLTPLHLASQDEDKYESAVMLLNSGANVNTQTGVTGETVLHITASYGSYRLMKLYLKEQADPRILTKNGESVLHYAAKHCRPDFVKKIIKYTRKTCNSFKEAEDFVNLPNRDGFTALHLAADMDASKVDVSSDKDIQIIKALLNGGANSLATTKLNDELPIHVAAKRGSIRFLDTLREFMPGLFASTINRPLKNGWTPLMLAAHHGRGEVIEFLLKYGARVDAFDDSGKNALHLAADIGSQTCCKILLDHRAFVNAKSKVGITPLHLAAQNGFAELAAFLIQNGAVTEAMALDRKTPLHLAAVNGHKSTVEVLLKLRAKILVKDLAGQTPLHLAGNNNHDEVVKVFLAFSPEVGFVPNQEGNTCAHIGAMNGSIAVIRTLVKIDKAVALAARNNTTGALPIHLAAKAGSSEIVRLLVDEGASLLDEDNDGFTAISQAAKEGHLNVIETITASPATWTAPSKKTGVNCFHVAAFYGHVEVLAELMNRIPFDSKTEKAKFLGLEDKKLADMIRLDYGFNALHIAAFANSEGIIRYFLTNLTEISHMERSAAQKMIPLHMAAYSGNTVIAGLLLTKSMAQLNIGDAKGLKPLHLAALNGHTDTVASFIGQGADIECQDTKMWTPLHHAAYAGQLAVVELLLNLGASVASLTEKRETALCLAAASRQIDVLLYLMNCDFDFSTHLDDPDFVYNLCACTRNTFRLPIEKFVLVSKSPLGTAARLTHAFTKLSEKSAEHAKDLRAVARYTEKLTAHLMEISATKVPMSNLLHATDFKGRPFIDALLEDNLKTVVGDSSVQRYMNEVWTGNTEWSSIKMMLLMAAFFFCPPFMIAMLLPFPHRYHKVPIIRFFGYFTSNIQFVAILYATVVIPISPNSLREDLWPTWNEMALLIMLGGMLTAELTNPVGSNALRLMKNMNIVFSAFAAFIHVVAFFVWDMDREWAQKLMYVRNQVLSIPVFVSVQMILEYLTFNYSFGPLVISFKFMLSETVMLVVVMAVFFTGFLLQFNTVYSPVCPDLEPAKTGDCICNIQVPKGCGTPYLPEGSVGCRASDDIIATLSTNFFLLFTALILNTDYSAITYVRNAPEWGVVLTRVHFAIFHMFLVLVLLTVIVAVAAEAFDRLNPHADLEWMYGRAKLIRDMVNSASTPPPLNLITKGVAYMIASKRFGRLMCTQYAATLALMQERATAGEDEENILNHIEVVYGDQRKKEMEKSFIFRLTNFLKRSTKMFGFEAFGQGTVIPRGTTQIKKTVHKHETLETVTDWSQVVERYNFLKHEEEEPESAMIPELGYSKNDMEEWQLALWEEMEEIEDEDEQRERRDWLIEEILNVVQSD